jgi:peptide/nickel transport system substrate-binding protein
MIERIPRKVLRTALAVLCCLPLLLAACTIEGGVPTTPPTPEPVLDLPPTNVAVVEQIAARRDTWAVGLLDPLGSLYPYPANTAAARASAPVRELLFPSPVLAYAYSYTTTGVLERLPSIENGDVEVRRADVYLDTAGNITTTATQVITQVEQLAVTFRWNPRLMWSDGTPVTADDSLFAYELARESPPSREARDVLDQTASYEKVDAHTTRAVLQPDVTGSVYVLSYWTPLPRHLLEDMRPEEVPTSVFAERPIGYGPYVIEERTPDAVHLTRNPYYFGSPPAASRVMVRIDRLEMLRAKMLNGNLDIIMADRVPAEVLATIGDGWTDGTEIILQPNPIWEHIDFNLDVQLLQDIRVRRAIAYGTNRQMMTDALTGGRAPVLHSWILPNQPDAAPFDQLSHYAHNPDEARRLLDEAGYVDADGDGVRVQATTGVTLALQLLTTDGNPMRAAIAEQFRSDMAAIGIQIEVLMASSEELFAQDGPLHQRQFDLVLFGWVARPEPSGIQLWSCAAVPSESNNWNGDNFAGWCFRDADRAVREAATALDPATRRAAYLRQQKLWTQEIPALPLFQRLSLVIATPDVRGLRSDTLAPITWNIAAWRRAD